MKDDDILQAVREFKQRAESYWHDIYAQAKEDIEFVVNKDMQWDETTRAERKRDKRPMLSINKLALFVKQQVNSLRANKMTLKAVPVDDSDVQKADIQDDILDYVLKNSRADIATDWAYEMAVKGGFGFVLLTTDYTHESTFDQDILIKRIENPQSTYISPESKDPTGADATEAITGEWLTKEQFKRQFPDAKPNSADEIGYDNGGDWGDDNRLFVAEYYRIEYVNDTLYQLSDGSMLLKSEFDKYQGDPALTVVKERPTQRKKVMWYKCSRDAVLERTELPFDFIPIILVVGDEQWVENKRYWQSMITNAKDPQILYNYVRTGQAEQLRKAMNRPWVADAKSIEGHEAHWQQANNPNLHFLPYNSTDEQGRPYAPPFLANVYQGSPDLMREALTASDEIKATTGIFDASLGAQSNETSGRAIMARQRQGDQANYHFLDNFKRSYEHMGRVILSAIPKIYDTPRVLRIATEDGEEQKFKTILVNVQQNSQLAAKYHKELAKMQAIDGVYNDLSIGRYDVRIATGADFNTQREESRELLMELGRNNPQLLQTAGDLIVKAFDFKDADKIAERLKKAMPPQLQDGEEGEDIPPQVQAMMQQIQAQMQQMGQALQQAQSELQSRDAEMQKDVYIAQIKANTDLEIAKLKLEGQEDVEEIKAMTQLILQHMQNFAPQEWLDDFNAPDDTQDSEDYEYPEDPANEQGFLMPEQSQPIDATDGDFALNGGDYLADPSVNGEQSHE